MRRPVETRESFINVYRIGNRNLFVRGHVNCVEFIAVIIEMGYLASRSVHRFRCAVAPIDSPLRNSRTVRMQMKCIGSSFINFGIAGAPGRFRFNGRLIFNTDCCSCGRFNNTIEKIAVLRGLRSGQKSQYNGLGFFSQIVGQRNDMKNNMSLPALESNRSDLTS